VRNRKRLFCFFNFGEEVKNVDLPVIHTFEDDRLKSGGKLLESRLFTGTVKYTDDGLIPDIIRKSGSQVITAYRLIFCIG